MIVIVRKYEKETANKEKEENVSPTNEETNTEQKTTATESREMKKLEIAPSSKFKPAEGKRVSKNRLLVTQIPDLRKHIENNEAKQEEFSKKSMKH